MNASRVFAIALMGAVTLACVTTHDSARAQVTQQGAGYLMRLKLTKGSTVRFDIATTVQMPGTKGGSPTTTNVPLTMHVTDVRNGIATITTTTTMPAMGKGKAQTMRETVKMDNRGRPQGQGAMAMEGMSFGYPQAPVRIGQSWTDTSTVHGISVRSTYRLVRVETVNRRRVANVATSMSTTGQGMSMSGTGTMLVRLDDGWPQSLTMNMRMSMGTGKQAQPVAVTTRMTRR